MDGVDNLYTVDGGHSYTEAAIDWSRVEDEMAVCTVGHPPPAIVVNLHHVHWYPDEGSEHGHVCSQLVAEQRCQVEHGTVSKECHVWIDGGMALSVDMD